MRKKIVFLFSLILILSSCGFKLRGYTKLPFWFNQIVIIEKNIDPYLMQQINKQLSAQGVNLAPDIHQAHYILNIELDGFQQQMTSVAASTTPRQYQLTYSLQYSLISAKGKKIRPSSHITILRQVTINNNRILGSNNEESTIRHEMQKEAANQLINQIAITNAN